MTATPLNSNFLFWQQNSLISRGGDSMVPNLSKEIENKITESLSFIFRSRAMKMLTLDQFCLLLSFTVARMKSYSGVRCAFYGENSVK